VPIEIFISYRRSDAGGHARYLFHALREAFEPQRIFFDLNSLEAGEDFPAEIDAAVRECRVLLALIGPGWVDAAAEGRRRLDDPQDFVRREIALALELGKRVVPVLIDRAALPSAAQLPAALAALPLRDAHEQHGKTYEYDAHLAELVRLLAALPGVSPPRARAAAGALVAERDRLPVLCDRSLQDDAAADTVRAELRGTARRPIVLVLHGRADEEHHAFVERLEGFSLPRLLKGTPFGAGLQFVRINDALPVDAGAAAFDRRLRERLADALEAGSVDDDAALLRQLQQLKLGTLVVVLSWRASELAGDPLAPLQRVFEYWANFPPLAPRQLAGCIVCLKYDRAGAAGLWQRLLGRGDRSAALRAAVEASAQRFGADPRLAWCVARELPSVTVADLDRWVLEVARLIGRFSVSEERLQAIIGGEARPMQAVLPELGKLVAATA
jgi:hypothetical protein